MQISSSAESRLTERRRQQPLEISSSTNTSHNRTVGFSPVPIIKVVLPILAIVASVVLHTQLPPFRTSQTMSSKTLPHIVVVGGGLAGLSAAAEALASGVRVTIIDKQQLGGNSAKATSGINAVLTRHQFASGITNDSISLFMGDVLKSGQGRTDRRLAHTLSARSTDAVTFLEEKLGHELSNVAILGGHSCPRTHRFSTASGSKPMPVGFTVISALKKFLNDEKWKGKIEIMEHTNITNMELKHELLPDGSSHTRVVSIKIEASIDDASTSDPQRLTPTSLMPDAVILSSGGFSADLGPNGLVSQFSQIASKCSYTTNGPFATGDLLKIGQRLGLETVDLDQIQLHPTSFVDPKSPNTIQKFLCPEVIRGSGALLLNRHGQRFVDELERRDVVSTAINQFGSIGEEWKMTQENNLKNEVNNKIAILLMNQKVRSQIGESTFDFYKARGLIQELGNVKEAALTLGFDIDSFDSTLKSYNDALHGKIHDQFGKKIFPTEYMSNDILYSAFITPAVHYTMGGLKINPEAQVLQSHQPVTNLFAAGEVSGGLHGGNRLGGNGMLESVVFGRIAGHNAANLHFSNFIPDLFIKHTQSTMTVSEFSPLSLRNELSDFSLLRLSFPSLNQTTVLPLGHPLDLLIRFRFPRARCAESGPIDLNLKIVPASSTRGYLNFIVPTFVVKELQDIHPGDQIELSATGSSIDSSSIWSSCDANTAMIVAHVASYEINVISQFALHVKNNPKLQLKVILLCPSSVDCKPLSDFIQNINSDVNIEIIRSDSIKPSITQILNYLESNQIPEIQSKQINQGIQSLQECFSA